MMIRVFDLRQEPHSTTFDVSASVTIDGSTQTMTFKRYGNHPHLRERTETYDPFAVALLVPAMLRNAALSLQGPVDEVLLFNLQGPIQDTIRLMAPELPKIAVTGQPVARPAIGTIDRRAACGFSGGVDSMYVVHNQHFGTDVPGPLRLNLLAHHHVGAHEEDDALFAERYAEVEKVAQDLGMPLVGASCKMNDLYQGRRFNEFHTMRSVAAAMSLDHLFSCYLFASSEEIGRKVTRNRFSGISTLEPQLLPLFNSERNRWIPVDGSAKRLLKTEAVIHDDRLCGSIQVCVRGFLKDRKTLNCGQCHKCARFLMQAEVSGRLDAVAPTFDLEAYSSGRNYAIFRMLRLALKPKASSNDVLLVQFLQRQGFEFPTWAKPFVALALLRHGRGQTELYHPPKSSES